MGFDETAHIIKLSGAKVPLLELRQRIDGSLIRVIQAHRIQVAEK